MNYGLFLYADLATGERIEILKRNFGGAPRKIAALSSWSWRPLDNDSAEVTDTPIVKGTLSMSIKDMRDFDYTAFFTVDSTLWRVVLKYGGVTRWSGYVQPESYSSNSEYRSDINIMALDNLGQLEHIEYDYFDYSFVSLRDLVQRACGLVGWNFAPIIFDTRVVSGDGVLIEDAVLNVETFRKKTWWEVLSDVLFSFGLQLAYFDDNAYRISSVANKFDATRIVDIPNYTIESGCTSDIVPSWKELVVRQDYQKFKESAVPQPKIADYQHYIDLGNVKTYIVTSGQIKSDGIPGINSNPLPVIIPQNITFPKGNGYEKALLIPFFKNESPENQNAYIDWPVLRSEKSLQIEVSVKSRLYQARYFGNNIDYDGSPDDYTWNLNFEVVLTPSDGSAVQYLYRNGFAEFVSGASRLITFKIDTKRLFSYSVGEKTQEDLIFNIISQGIPKDGILKLKVFRNTGNDLSGNILGGYTVSVYNSIRLIIDESLPATAETKVSITKKARKKKEVDIRYGELPLDANSVSYAGGVFKNNSTKYPLHDWQRTDGLGGVLPLSEIVWRGYVHHFSRFQTNAGEPAGGKVLRGRFPFEGLKLNNILKYSTKESTEYYVINSASISGREADLTLMQVIPYAHYTDFDIENFVDAGGGSFVGGGGDTYVTHMTGGGGADLNGKRLFALDEAADEQINDLYLLADKPGNTVAQKIKARTFARRTHAKQHFKGGADEIKPYDIDAAKRAGDKTQDFAIQDLTARNATVADTARALKVISPNITSPQFLAAMLGYGFGGYVDENGESHLWADHLHGRVSFETLEMRYRKLLVSGEDLLVSSGGVVEEVLPLGQSYLSTPNGRLVITQDGRRIIVPSNGRVVFKLKGEPGIDIQQFDTDDILRYTWRDTETGNDGASGWLRIKHSFDTFWYEAEVVSGSPEWLQKGMSLGQFGNYTKKYRQGFINISARDKQIAIWDDVDSHILTPEMLKVYLGDLRYVTDSDFPIMKGFGLYAQSCYLKGVFVLKSTGKTVEAEIKASADGIKLEVSKTYATKVETSKIEQTANEIKLEVSKKVNGTEVISSINQTAEKIRIKSKLIELAGDTLIDDAFITKLIAVNAFIENLTAKNIDTRDSRGQGVVLTRGSDSISVYGWSAIDPDIKLWFGKTTGNVTSINPTLELGHTEWDRTVLSKSGGLKIFYGSSVTPKVELGVRGIKLPADATVDMPGVLCAGRVSGNNPYMDQWGALVISLERISEGKFRLHHDLEHQGYYTLATPARLYANRPMLMVTVVNETPTYSEVWVTDRSNENPLNGDFNFTIIGNGKQV